MTFQELAELMIAEMGGDGDTSITLPTAAPYFSTAFGLRLQLLLQAFTKDTYLLFSPREEITVEDGDREFSFADTDNCALNFFDVRGVWLDNFKINRASSMAQVLAGWSPLTPVGTPSSFAQMNSQKIIFNIEVGANIDDCFCMGFYRHPAIAADEDEILLAGEEVLLFEPYAQANLRRNVAADELGLVRLREVNKSAFEAVMSLRTKQMRLMYQSAERV